MVRAGRASSGRSKNNSSTPDAVREKTLKLTPAGETVAPGAALRRSVSIPALVTRGSLPPEQFLDFRHHAVGLEAELSLQLLERRRGAERLHADDASAAADVAVPAERGALLDRDPRRHGRQKHAVAVLLRLFIEDLPRRHRDDARADALRGELLVRLDRE